MTGSAQGSSARGAGAGAPPANEATWEQINWDHVVEEVTRLQARIAKATQAGKWNKVQALQHLLTHSRSGKLVAVKRVTENTGKRTAGVDGKHCSMASAVERRGRKPYEFGSAVVSATGFNARSHSACIARSNMVGIPNGRFLPLLLGIYTRRSGSGW